ncbi:hypothetical protein C8A00DRAFT_39871 [Chaetomidium leptoderma]|uniref:PinX1-related protein 1 n=1 Tax=Chaetomidium leptoderma TaxID=669021 RepID=A0AAN7A1D1_9PEZI|nr:hypothetical protein C8A00DRAFT_39871 [Chaetomidium leptoderma]
MGLAGAKNKRKLGNDPNNTKWSRNTDSFGQKLLRAQGWQPGEYLGAKDAPHAEWHTEANTTHIKVVLKDDTLGLGAKRNNGDECTGLDAFQHLLGRLNGKTDETLETERKTREDFKTSVYIERKFGTIRFVKGGWLVGDQVKDTPDEKAAESEDGSTTDTSKDATEESGPPEPALLKSKKRKADQDTDREDEKARRREKKSKKRKTDSEAEGLSESVKEKKDKKDKKKSKKRRAKSEESVEEKATEDSAQSTSAAVSDVGELLGEVDISAEARKAKKEKKDKKRDKKEKKERRKKDKTASDSGASAGDNISKEKKRRKDGAASETTSSGPTPAESNLSTPSGSGYSTPVTTSTRYLARSRFIAQKRMAFADTAALNQIFMIKS